MKQSEREAWPVKKERRYYVYPLCLRFFPLLIFIFSLFSVFFSYFYTNEFYSQNELICIVIMFQGPPQAGQQFKFTVVESLDRVKDEFTFLQQQYHKWVIASKVVFNHVIVLELGTFFWAPSMENLFENSVMSWKFLRKGASLRDRIFLRNWLNFMAYKMPS